MAGLYFFSEKIRDILINQLVNSIQTVTYPALSSLQSDKARLKAGCRDVMRVSTFLVFPTLLLVAALAAPMFKVFFQSAGGQVPNIFNLCALQVASTRSMLLI